MRFDEAASYARERLENELSPALYYHGPFHTRDEVVPATQRLAEMEDIRGEALALLLTAAWYHDLGYTEQAVHHELIGARMVQEILPQFKYSGKQIEVVRWAILATALPQDPQNHLEQILCDADLDVLGRDDFRPRNADLRRELAGMGKTFTDVEWYTGQLKFLLGHTYFTESAHALRDAQKSVNVEALRKALQQSEAVG
jgi:uncharacterized protein